MASARTFLPNPPGRVGRRRSRGVDAVVGVALVLGEGLAAGGVLYLSQLRQWGMTPAASLDHSSWTLAEHWIICLAVAALVIAAVAASRRAPWTATAQLAACLLLLTLANVAADRAAATDSQPPPSGGLSCRTGSSCPGG
ncbi:DUF6234 family protein [Streptacidiphilus sp. P02-A3a]|uniref:DUF6234 family protein n=1 Tax=Streptacidiphilus sp. P02-A3a TaxID=2704468 RepID=UPI0015FD5987|nr:DUF6234 family protein [Streptacidiphilus sp. P02-A3a]QMU69066.1 hypothetical protein GXP74_13265 [Streptacidiphilus sp. P02-A3a]